MFFFTREPYSRILSAYVDKLWSPNLHFWRVLGRGLVGQVRAQVGSGASNTHRSLDCGHDVTFPEFIRYFVQGMTRDVRVNTHLVPTHKFCEACTYDYDYIGTLETFREDAAFILSAINMTLSSDVSNDDDIIRDHIVQAFYTDFYDKKKCEKKHNLLLRAWRALQIRGVISMNIAFPFSEAMSRFLPKDIFNKTVYNAVRKTELLMRNLDTRLSQSRSELNSRVSNSSSQSEYFLTARAIQRRMALASAYSLIPMKDRLKMMELLREEFELFGYDPRPSDVFSPGYPLNTKIFDLSNI
ncbi:uncharacterized protein LOC143280460 [Babylonia areolata]|uniref:uncharacterized protein LOC143280460 n=1 Tax=Babylonia areolata TaxID=304850 RepID=UPI003FCFFEE7